MRAARHLPALLAAALPLTFLPISVDAYVLPRTSLLLLFAGAGAALLTWKGPSSLGTLRWPAATVAIAALVACATSITPALSVAGAYSRYEDAPVRLAYVASFWSAACLLRTDGDRRRLVSFYVVASCIVALEAVWQAWPGNFSGRPDGNLGQPGLLGAVLAMAVPPAVDRGTRAGRRKWLLAIPVLLAGLAVSLSRSGWLGAAIGSAVVLAARLAAARRLSRPVVGAVPAVAAAIAFAVLLLTPLRALNQDTGSARLHLWADTAGAIAARPLTGWGEDTFGLVIGRFLHGDWEPGVTFDRAHSQPLDLLMAQGVLGLAAVTAFWAVYAAGIWKHRRSPEVAPLAAGWLAGLVWSLLNFDWAPATGLQWLLAGAAWSAVSDSRQGRASPRVPVAAPVAIAIAAAAVLLALPPLAADIAYYKGELRTAVTLDPLQARYRQAVGEDELARGDRAAAARDLRMAEALGSSDARVYVETGDILKSERDTVGARAQYARALELYPFDRDARSRYSSSSSK